MNNLEILPQLIVYSLITGSIYALASSGLSLVYGLLKVMNFAHGHMMMLGAYLFYLFRIEYDYSISLSTMCTFGSLVIISFITFQIFVTPFLQLSYLLPLVTTLALSNILEALVSMRFGVNVKTLSTSIGLESIKIGSIYITPIQIMIILSALIFLCLFAWLIHYTTFGRNIRALSEDPYAAESLGINVKRLRLEVFLLSGLLAGYAGIMVGYETNLQPTFGSAYTVKAFAAMILGGLGNIWGTILGAYILGFVENFGVGLDFNSYYIPAGYKDAFSFVIILFTLLFFPEGIFKTKLRKV
jgi:branched-chain amino acid transport system permease protein